MKTSLLLLLLILFTTSLQATVHQVQVSDFSFTPSNVNALCGDTIQWNWVSGMHTTTSFSIPPCANGWNGLVNSASPAFAWVVSCGGTYIYECSLHPSMIGTINVGCATGIPGIHMPGVLAVPNPFIDRFRVSPGSNNYMQLTDATGRTIREDFVLPHTEHHFSGLDLAKGMYFLRFYSDGFPTETLKLIRN